MAEKHIVIIGAGIAGLSIAYRLAGHFDVTLIEASGRIGGRINTLKADNFSGRIEAGAEFIHGNAQNTYALLKAAGISYTEVSGEFYRENEGELGVQDEMVAGWDTLLERLSALENDMTLEDFLYRFFPGAEYAELRLQAQSYAGGFDLADPEKVSAKTLYREWSDETPEYRINGGYGLLVDFLEKECIKMGCTIVLDSAVKKISWAKDEVTVQTDKLPTFRAEKCIVTLPLPLLQRQGNDSELALSFDPEIQNYHAAFNAIGYGTVVKVVFEFNTAFWKKDMGFVFGEVPFPTWWTQLPDDNLTLTGWAGGAHADALAGASDKELLDSAIFSISKIFHIPEDEVSANLRASFIRNWTENPYSSGAYSYATPESKNARKLLATPIADTLYFCGEAIYDGPDQGTVEAAITSAYSTAALILSSFES